MNGLQNNKTKLWDDEASSDTELLHNEQPHFVVINTIADVHYSNDLETTDLHGSTTFTKSSSNTKGSNARLLEQNKGMASLCENADYRKENLEEGHVGHVAIEMTEKAETEKNGDCAIFSTEISANEFSEHLNTSEEQTKDEIKPLISDIDAKLRTKPLPCSLDIIKNEKSSKRLRILAQLGIRTLAIVWLSSLFLLPVVSIITFVSEFGFGGYLLYSLFYLLVSILTTRQLIKMFKTKSIPKGDDLFVLLFGTAIAFIIMFVVYNNGENFAKNSKFSPSD